MAAEGMEFSWRWNGGAIFLNLGVIWEMSGKHLAGGGSARLAHGTPEVPLPIQRDEDYRRHHQEHRKHDVSRQFFAAKDKNAQQHREYG